MALHLLDTHSDPQVLEDLGQLLAPGDAILLLDARRPPVLERWLQALPPGTRVQWLGQAGTDMDGFVRLTTLHHPVLSWY